MRILWIRNRFRIPNTGFNADPDPAFYLIADPDSGSQTNAVPVRIHGDPDLDPG